MNKPPNALEESLKRILDFIERLKEVEKTALEKQDIHCAFKILELQAKCLLHIEYLRLSQFPIQPTQQGPIQIEIIPPEQEAVEGPSNENPT